MIMFNSFSCLSHNFTAKPYYGSPAALEERSYYDRRKDSDVVLGVKDGFAFCKNPENWVYCFALDDKAMEGAAFVEYRAKGAWVVSRKAYKASEGRVYEVYDKSRGAVVDGFRTDSYVEAVRFAESFGGENVE